MLLNSEWVEYGKDGIRITEPALLLRSWADDYRYTLNDVSDFYTMLPLDECEQKLASFCEAKLIEYGISGFSREASLEPSVKYNRIIRDHFRQ